MGCQEKSDQMMGQKTGIFEALPIFLRSSHNDNTDDTRCFAAGRSTSNQRIEAYGLKC